MSHWRRNCQIHDQNSLFLAEQEAELKSIQVKYFQFWRAERALNSSLLLTLPHSMKTIGLIDIKGNKFRRNYKDIALHSE